MTFVSRWPLLDLFLLCLDVDGYNSLNAVVFLFRNESVLNTVSLSLLIQGVLSCSSYSFPWIQPCKSRSHSFGFVWITFLLLKLLCGDLHFLHFYGCPDRLRRSTKCTLLRERLSNPYFCSRVLKNLCRLLSHNKGGPRILHVFFFISRLACSYQRERNQVRECAAMFTFASLEKCEAVDNGALRQQTRQLGD